MIYFIRHGQSQGNDFKAYIKAKHGQKYRQAEQYLSAKFGKEHLDPQLTEKGVQQCLMCNKKMKQIDVDLVIVSPLKRALKTCSLVFDQHPSKPSVIVHPHFRQILCSSNDIGSKLVQSMKQYQSYDFSHITRPWDWYLHSIEDQQNQTKSSGQCESQAAVQVALQFLRQQYHKRLSDPTNEQLEQKLLPSLQRQREILMQKLKKHKNIAVVSHCQSIKAYVGRKIDNCQVYSFSQEKLQSLVAK